MRSMSKCEFVFTLKLVVWDTLYGSNLKGFTQGEFIYFCDKNRQYMTENLDFGDF